jgi:hypothetical protein
MLPSHDPAASAAPDFPSPARNSRRDSVRRMRHSVSGCLPAIVAETCRRRCVHEIRCAFRGCGRVAGSQRNYVRGDDVVNGGRQPTRPGSVNATPRPYCRRLITWSSSCQLPNEFEPASPAGATTAVAGATFCRSLELLVKHDPAVRIQVSHQGQEVGTRAIVAYRMAAGKGVTGTVLTGPGLRCTHCAERSGPCVRCGRDNRTRHRCEHGNPYCR